jgi:hypothetical protein
VKTTTKTTANRKRAIATNIENMCTIYENNTTIIKAFTTQKQKTNATTINTT